jgi:HD-GYP domain-containing protein (c-di-GMP phosphodiesterase class II)
MGPQAFQQIIATLSLIMDYQEGRQLYHAWRVAIVAKFIAEEAIPEKAGDIFYAALLHDIGIRAPGEHPSNFSDLIEASKSYPWLRHHSTIGANIVKEIPGLEYIAPLIEDHHEWWGGIGFPAGKKGDEIDSESQIIRMADSFDLLLRNGEKTTKTDIYDYFRTHSGKEFSDSLWPSFLRFNTRNMGILFYEINEDSKVPLKFHEIFSELPSIEVGLSDDFTEKVLRLFGRLIDAKHAYTERHSEGVANYSRAIAERMGLSKEDIEVLYYAAYLHDFGKVAIPVSILDKPGPLAPEERKVVERHAVYTMELIHSIEAFWHLAPLAGYSQEHYDGSGYPDGLKRDEIPTGARIIAVADAIDAMTSDRPYRKALGTDVAIKELRRCSGTQFDPKVVEAAISFMEESHKSI